MTEDESETGWERVRTHIKYAGRGVIYVQCMPLVEYIKLLYVVVNGYSLNSI